MDMPEIIKIPTVEKMNKYPWATTCVVLFTVCVFLMISLLKKPDCQEELNRVVAENSRLHANQDALTSALLISNGINTRLGLERKELDSTINKKLGAKAKQILRSQ